MRLLRALFGDRFSGERGRADWVSVAWSVSLLLLLPALAVLLVITAGEAERQPQWDTGFMDASDRALTTRALATHPPSNSTHPRKIAFLFLIRGQLPLESLWERFLKVCCSLSHTPGVFEPSRTEGSPFLSVCL